VMVSAAGRPPASVAVTTGLRRGQAAVILGATDDRPGRQEAPGRWSEADIRFAGQGPAA